MDSFSPQIGYPPQSQSPRQGWNAARTLSSLLLGMIVGVCFPLKVAAHNAPSGWSYPYQCCSDRDCRPVHGAAIVEGPDGYVVEETGEIIGYKDSRLKPSPDDEFHLCLRPGNVRSRAICLFVPPRFF